jgi:hypothetical protein
MKVVPSKPISNASVVLFIISYLHWLPLYFLLSAGSFLERILAAEINEFR